MSLCEICACYILHLVIIGGLSTNERPFTYRTNHHDVKEWHPQKYVLHLCRGDEDKAVKKVGFAKQMCASHIRKNPEEPKEVQYCVIVALQIQSDRYKDNW